jgi:hypothetical protein
MWSSMNSSSLLWALGGAACALLAAAGLALIRRGLGSAAPGASTRIPECQSAAAITGEGPEPAQPNQKPHEQRVSLRRKDPPVPVEIAAPDSKKKPGAGWVLERSTTGLCIWTAQQFPVGAVLRVRSTQYRDPSPWVDVEVRRCQPAEDQWVLGCKFTAPQPWSILLLFG